jgi:hypothetical protein
MMLTRKDTSIGIDGEQWIFTTRIKTDTASRIPLLPIARDILEKYSKQPGIINSGRLLVELNTANLLPFLLHLAKAIYCIELVVS